MNLNQALDTLVRAGIDSARLDTQLLLAHVLCMTREELLMRESVEMTEFQSAQFAALVARRASRIPISQLLGRKEFWGLTFKVSADTLTPRPDSETIIEALLAHQPRRSAQLRILDLGTGTGCLLLAALSEYPQSRGLGVDISERALAVAAENAASLRLEKRAEFKKSVWNSAINGVWDIVISNPPYIPAGEIQGLAPEVSRHEPRLALDGGSDGLDCYREITRFLPEILAESGMALLEVGRGQAQDVASLGQSHGLSLAGIACDLSGVGRCVILKKQ